MPDGGGMGADGGSAGYSDPVGGVGMGAGADSAAGAISAPGYEGQAGRDLQDALGRGADYDMAEGWALNNPNQVAEDIGFVGADYGKDYGRAATSAWNSGNYGLAAGRAGLGLADKAWSNKGAILGYVGGMLTGGPVAANALSAAGSVFDGKGPAEAAGQFFGGFAPGVAGLFGSRGGGMLGASLDAHMGTGPPGSEAPNTSFSFDHGPPGQGPASEMGGDVDFIPAPGQTYEAYLPPQGQTGYPEPAWRGLLGRGMPPPPPNLWQGNRLTVPGRGIL